MISEKDYHGLYNNYFKKHQKYSNNVALSVLNKKQLVGININSNFIILVFIIYKTENTFSFCKINFESSTLSSLLILFIQLNSIYHSSKEINALDTCTCEKKSFKI